ncbi:branched-chain amino acid ABC transporter permease [Skermanella stibiiresistens]|uniref:branched-chain amino acid ABC transporter permease n=1 Tax=Skermanella stibiiresistens TaxID=913326 RepID=UPI0004BC3D84|nr:branched-chain amino acid ABC transporter permease [Skermanella stibiiresistens]
MTTLFDQLTARGRVALGLFALALLAVPFFADGYLISVITLVLWFAYVGQAWNVMMGFAGQLSLGHSLYVGLGAYASAALFVHFGVGPWAGVWLGMLAATLAGAIIGTLGFRFAIRGVHFALLTIAFAEFTRIAFDHIGWLGGSGGFFLPVGDAAGANPFDLRGSPALFYYVILALTFGALALCRRLLHSRIGYFWLAIREDQEAAQAVGIDVFRAKLIAVMISAAMTSLGGVFYAFFYNNLFPEQIFSVGRSIELILAPVIGGIGTLFGPIFGAFILTPLAELVTWGVESAGLDMPGIKQIFYGLALVAIVVYRPEGVWPWVARHLRLVHQPGDQPSHRAGDRP